MSTTSTYNEKELVVRLIGSDSKAFELIYYHYAERVFHFAMRYLKNKSESEEVIQEVFTKIWENRHNINPELSFNGYLLTTIKNTIFNENRKKMYHQTYVGHVLKYLQSHVKDLQEELTYDNLMELINSIIDKMPAKRQEIFRLCRTEGMSHKEISKKLGISEKTIEAHMRLAIRDIKTVLSPILNKIL